MDNGKPEDEKLPLRLKAEGGEVKVDTFRARLTVRGIEQHTAHQFFWNVTSPLLKRFKREKSSLDLCCAATVMLDQMIDWISEEAGEHPNATRRRLAEKEPLILKLNAVSRVIKHRELNRDPHKGLRDVYTRGNPGEDDWPPLAPLFKTPEGEPMNADELLDACSIVIADELDP